MQEILTRIKFFASKKAYHQILQSKHIKEELADMEKHLGILLISMFSDARPTYQMGHVVVISRLVGSKRAFRPQVAIAM